MSDRLGPNQYLERLELEGNNLTAASLSSLSKLLQTNETLRLLDLEGNPLIKGEK